MSPIRVVQARSRKQLRTKAYMLRKKFKLENVKSFPIVDFLELIMPQVEPDFVLEPVADSELVGRAAETFPGLHLIRVKESVYDAACEGNYWARIILAHELGHYICHSDETPVYAYPTIGERIPNNINPEKQADIFASELLAPVHLIDEQSNFLVSKHYGVPLSVARIQMDQVKKIKHRHQKKRCMRDRKNG